jgi:probable selenium-dependent hydroxylase accessory protein YqeC
MGSLQKALDLEGGGMVSLVGAGGKTSLMFRLAKEFSDAGKSVLSTTTTKIMMPDRHQSPQIILDASPQVVLEKAKKLLKDNRHVSAVSPRLADYPDKVIGFEPEIVGQFRKSGLFHWIVVEADGAAQKPMKVPAAHEPVIPAATDWLIGVVGLKVIDKPLNPEWVFRNDLYTEITGLLPGELVTEASVCAAVTHKKGVMKGCPPNARKAMFLNITDAPRGLAIGKRIAQILNETAGQTKIEKVVIGKPLENPPVVARIDLTH